MKSLMNTMDSFIVDMKIEKEKRLARELESIEREKALLLKVNSIQKD